MHVLLILTKIIWATEWICEYQEWGTSGLMLEHWSEGENIP